MLRTGTVLDARYEIIAPLGAGSMGQVYRARRPLLGDEVAVKLMRASFNTPADASVARARFLRESRACAQLRHPNIVTILDFNVDAAGQPYLVMELLSGPSLRDEIELGGAMAPATVAAILAPVAAALQLAHERGITHRDLKPANIVAHRYASSERVYKVIDFGLASITQATDDTRLTAPNLFLGTMAYAAPEQMRGEPLDHRADIYALGVIAYEMLTGRRPFEASDPVALLNQMLRLPPVAPGHHAPGLSSRIDAVVLRALAKEAPERWPSVHAFATELHAAAGPLPASDAAAVRDDSLLSRYELGDVLGRGRLGSLVYRGTHRALGAPVAIRVLRREEQPGWDAVRTRFLLEARTLQVQHPNLLHVRDYGEGERLVYLVTDYIQGCSLREELALAGKLAWPRVAALLAQMLDATAALNARGGFIAGVNPDMIRLSQAGDRDLAVMSTAGIATVQDVLATMREQELRGEEANEQELPYVAPEVLMGRGPAPPADVFTAGVLAYQMATGMLPFRARSLPELIGQMLQRRPAEPRALNGEVPEGASQAIVRSLAADPTQRFADARAFAEGLRVP